MQLNLAEISQKTVQKLLVDHVAIVEEAEWSQEVRDHIEKILLQHHVNDLKVFYSDVRQHYVFTIRNYTLAPGGFEMAYSKNSLWRKLLPLLIVGTIFAFTALLSYKLNALMSGEFLILLPLTLGALVDYFYNYQNINRSNLFKQQGQCLVVIILFSIIVLREGVICLIMASPLLYAVQVAGGGIMRTICYGLWKPSMKVYSLSIVPLLMILANPFASNTLFSTTQNEIVIHAPVQEVYQAINNIQQIQESEIKSSPIFWMGFPKPTSGMTVADGEGFTRQIHWQRGIYFEEAITHHEPNSLLGWTYRFTPESFPKGSLDDHLEIGGEYFDLAYTDYRLEKISEHQTKLILTIDYRLSTEINWYAKPWADYVLNEFSDVVLNVYKTRLEKQ